MLVIRRRPGEAICVGEDVEIEIIECGPNRVKLGVRAPRQVAVWRAEVSATRAQNIAAAGWAHSGHGAAPGGVPARWTAKSRVVPLVRGSRE